MNFLLSVPNKFLLQVHSFLFDKSSQFRKCYLNKRDDIFTGAATHRCSYEKVFWKYAANLHENTHAEVRFR